MKEYSILLLIFLLTIGCDDSGTNIDESPQRVQWIEKTADDYIGGERGIDAFGEVTNSIILEWKAVPDKDVKQYIIYATNEISGGEPVNFISKRTLDINQVNPGSNFDYNKYADSSYCYNFNVSEFGFALLQETYYYIRAKDKGGNLSENSDTLHYKLLNAPILPYFNTDEDFFTWHWPDGIPTGSMILRIEVEPYNSLEPFYVKKIYDYEIPDYYTNPAKLYVSDINVNLNHGAGYRFRIDMYDGNYSGSESAWNYFTF